MLVLSNSFTDKPVASIQSGHRVAVVQNQIIDPKDLKIFALTVDSPNLGTNLVVHTEDIRDFNHQGIIVDSNDQLMTFDDDLVRLKKVAEINFHLIGKSVYTENGKKLGKVSEYVVDTDSFFITKLHVNRSMAKSFGSSQLIIDRSQVVKVTDRRVVVKSTSKKVKSFSFKEMFVGKGMSLSPDQTKANSDTK